MGEVLQGPWGTPAADRSADGSAARTRGSGAGRDPAPSRHPASAGARQRQDEVLPLLDAGRPAGDDEQAGPESEPAWAVPGVDADEPVPLDPPQRSAKAERVALAALTRHDASEGEIRARLVAKGLDEAAVEGELDRLRRAGLVDDAAFAARQVERLRERKGLGDSAVRSALRGRLVPQDVIDAVLAEQAEDEDEADRRLQQVADDRARRLGSLSYDVAERRLTAYLMRKGFGGSSVRTAARAALETAGIR